MAITNLTETQRKALRDKTPYSLPDNPKDYNLKAATVKPKFYGAICDETVSLWAMINDVIDEANTDITTLAARVTQNETDITTIEGGSVLLAADNTFTGDNEFVEELKVATAVEDTSAPNKLQMDSAIATAISDLINGADSAYDTLKELADALTDDEEGLAALLENINSRVVATDLAETTGSGTVGYNNASSGLTATQVQAAIDELESKKLDKDFSALSAITLADDDLIPVADITDNTVKKATVSDLSKSFSEWGIITTSGSINFNFTTNKLELIISTSMQINYKNNYYSITEDTEISLTETVSPRGFIIFNTNTNEFSTIESNLSSLDSINNIIIGTYRTYSKEAFMLGEYTVDGFIVSSDNKTKLSKPFLDVYYRWKRPIITSTTITFPSGLRIYTVDPELTYVSYTFSADLTLTFVHNSTIIWDTASDTISQTLITSSIGYDDVVLFQNIEGNIVGGRLKNQYENEIINELHHIQIGEVLNKVEQSSPTPLATQGSTVVKNELWTFSASNDENTNTALCLRYTINSYNSLSYVGQFTHNLGHVNSISYNENNDTLILGNGSSDYDLDGTIIIIPNASNYVSLSNLDISTDAIVIDVSSMSWGSKTNVVWGEYSLDNNICYVVTDDNTNIRKILLGTGTNNLTNGTYAAASTGEFNGTFNVLNEYYQAEGLAVIQDMFFSKDGHLYVGLGHEGLWYCKMKFNDVDGTIIKEEIKTKLYSESGSKITSYMESIDEYNGNLIIRIVEDLTIYIYIIDNGNNKKEENGTKFVGISDKTVGDTTTETSVIPTSNIGSLIFNADAFYIGKTIRVRTDGIVSALNNAESTLNVKLGTTTLMTSTSNFPAAVSGVPYVLEFELTCRTDGATGVITGGGQVTIFSSFGITTAVFRPIFTTGVTIDTTESLTLDVTYKWTTASASNTVCVYNFVLEELN